MENENNKPRIKISLGGFIILVILALILFKVDIKEKIDSPQFKKNWDYISTEVKDLWSKYISTPLKAKSGELMVDMAKKGFDEIQKNMGGNAIDIDSIQKEIQ